MTGPSRRLVALILAGSVGMCSVAFAADEVKPPPADLPAILAALHEAYTLMIDQLGVLEQQQQDMQLIRIDIMRLTAACGRKPAAPPVYSEPEH